MSGGNSANESIRSFLFKKFPAARKRAIGETVPLLESGIVDSLGMLDVVAFLEQSFHIQVQDDELTPDNFGTIERLGAFVERKRGRVEVPAE